MFLQFYFETDYYPQDFKWFLAVMKNRVQHYITDNFPQLLNQKS